MGCRGDGGGGQPGGRVEPNMQWRNQDSVKVLLRRKDALKCCTKTIAELLHSTLYMCHRLHEVLPTRVSTQLHLLLQQLGWLALLEPSWHHQWQQHPLPPVPQRNTQAHPRGTPPAPLPQRCQWRRRHRWRTGRCHRRQRQGGRHHPLGHPLLGRVMRCW